MKEGGRIKTLKKRWFILRETSLAYYKDEKDETPQGIISLKESKASLTSEAKRPFCFAVATPERTYVCSATSDDEMWEWINAITYGFFFYFYFFPFRNLSPII